jgi:hypothetical protein
MLEPVQKRFKKKAGARSVGIDNPNDFRLHKRPYGRYDARNYLSRHIKEENDNEENS